MPRVHIDINDLDETEDQARFQPMTSRRHRDHEGRATRRRPLNADEARDLGRKPRDARQSARSSQLVF